MSSTTAAEAAKARAEASFKRQHEQEDAQAAGLQTVEAERAAVAAKTAKLRALRLAKEESDRIAAEVRRARRQR